MTDIPTPADLPAPAPEAPQDATDDAQVFDAAYVSKLRQEAAETRVKARAERERIASQAVRAMAQADGRLVDLDVLQFDAAMMDDDGLVDPAKVSQAIDVLIESKPYLRTVAAPPVTQGYREPAATVTLMDLIKGNV